MQYPPFRHTYFKKWLFAGKFEILTEVMDILAGRTALSDEQKARRIEGCTRLLRQVAIEMLMPDEIESIGL